MICLDPQGRDVIDMPGLWSEEDCELMTTNYMHPMITTGQHTNGPATIWIRYPAETGDWRCTFLTHMHKVRQMWVDGELPIHNFPKGTINVTDSLPRPRPSRPG